MKKILITGASGFIGSYLKDNLSGYEISTLSLRDPNWKNQPINADVVIHCAALAHNTRYIKSERYQSVNCDLVSDLLSHINCSTKFILLSSILVLGSHKIGGLSVSHLPVVKNKYSMSKQCAERVLLNNHRIKDKIIIRLPLVIGDNPKGNLRIIKVISKHIPFFLKTYNAKAVLFMEDLLTVIDTSIISSENLILNPYSKILSTDQIYEYYRKQSNRRSIIFSFPRGFVAILRSIKPLSRIFGDLYFIEGDKVD